MRFQAFDRLLRGGQKRINLEHPLVGFQGPMLVSDSLKDAAEAHERAEMAWLPRQDLLDVGRRAGEVILEEKDGGASIPGLDPDWGRAR